MTGPRPGAAALDRLLARVRDCRVCAAHLPHPPRPVLHVSATAKVMIVGQAPGVRVHETGISFNDPSGDRLRTWMGVTREEFYDESRIAVVPMGFCFPGTDDAGADKPPRRECVAHWHARLFAAAPRFSLILAVGAYAHAYHLKGSAHKTVTGTVRAWRDYRPKIIPLPHPSWRNNAWLKRNSWFEIELLPYLRRRVRRVLASAR
ncbi:MAG: uracil-DNA glycosylase family protein [Proteobacteria bacterium]|nr:uracil-DNA glycosylase family protein [Pseudomonadota bacterium]